MSSARWGGIGYPGAWGKSFPGRGTLRCEHPRGATISLKNSNFQGRPLMSHPYLFVFPRKTFSQNSFRVHECPGRASFHQDGLLLYFKINFTFSRAVLIHATLSRNGRDSPNVPTCTAPPHTPFVTLSDPTVTRHHHPESRVDIRGHSWWCTFCVGFGQMHDDIYLP